MKILLDTCTFLWVINDPKKLSTSAKRFFTSASNELYLSPVSIWEIVIKEQKGGLSFPKMKRPIADFLIEQRKAHEIEPLPLAEKAVAQLSKLPEYHRDPFDRMLICQAIAHRVTLLTPDEAIQQYPVSVDW